MAESTLKPAIRFRGFTDAWEQRKLSGVAQSFEYGLNAAATEFDGNNKYLRITDIDDSTHEFKLDDLTSPDVDLTKAENYRLRDGDILFARTGASVGKTYQYKDFDGIVYFAGFLIRARIKPDYDSGFIFQNTLTSRYNNFISVTSQRSGQPGVNAQEYGDFILSVPKLPEQTAIGSFFSSLDKLITLHQREHDKIANIKKAMLEKMFPKDGADKPEIRFPGFTNAWEQRKLDYCFTERVERSNVGELISVTINSGVMKAVDLGRHDTSSDDKSNYKKVEVGDIAYNSMRMWQGASGYSPYSGILSPAYTVITPKTGIYSPFFAYLFKRPDMIHAFEINSQGLTSDTWNLKWPALSAITATVPSYKEQQRISTFFSNLDKLITLHQRELTKLQNIKKAMLEKMFPPAGRAGV